MWLYGCSCHVVEALHSMHVTEALAMNVLCCHNFSCTDTVATE